MEKDNRPPLFISLLRIIVKDFEKTRATRRVALKVHFHKAGNRPQEPLHGMKGPETSGAAD
jgi:hypothetical protein